MKKRCIAILMVALLLLVGGCGKSNLGKAVSANKDVLKNAVSEGVSVAEEVIEEVADVVEDASDVTDEVSDEVVEEPEEVEEGYNPAKQYEGKPYMVSQDVLDNDNSEEYGVYSKSCFDLDQYLDEEGALPGVYDWDNKDWDTYTGRWSYPEVTQSDIFKDMALTDKTDKYERYYFKDKSDNETVLFIDSGIRGYLNKVDSTEMAQYSDNPMLPQLMFTTETVDGSTDVVSIIKQYSFDDGETWQYRNEYVFHVGNFTVTVQCAETQEDEDPIELTEEEIQEIIDNIRLTNGLER